MIYIKFFIVGVPKSASGSCVTVRSASKNALCSLVCHAVTRHITKAKPVHGSLEYADKSCLQACNHTSV